MSRFDKEVLAQAFGVAPMAFTEIPKAETYIMQGECLPWTAPKRVPLMSWTTRERIGIASWHRSQGSARRAA